MTLLVHFPSLLLSVPKKYKSYSFLRGSLSLFGLLISWLFWAQGQSFWLRFLILANEGGGLRRRFLLLFFCSWRVGWIFWTSRLTCLWIQMNRSFWMKEMLEWQSEMQSFSRPNRLKSMSEVWKTGRHKSGFLPEIINTEDTAVNTAADSGTCC